MAQNFPGKQDEFFFRKREQLYIEQRLQHAGVTVIRGRPRAGKSWLSGQVLRGVVQSSSKTLIGFTRCSLQDDDNLLRVIDDLYLRWFEDATLLDQAKDLFNKNKGRWLPMVANAVAALLEASQALGPASGIASKALQKLASDDGPALRAPRLKYEQGRQFINALATISEADRTVLVLDSWEQSANIEFEAEHLREFVRNPQEWANTHLLITVEADGEADALLQSISIGMRPWVDIYDMPPLDIERNPEEKERLTTFLRNIVPACRAVNCADDFLCLIDGYPGVLNNWTRHGAPERLNTLGDLSGAAMEAQLGRYPEFDRRLPGLDSAARQLCIRLALLPDSDETQWLALRPVLTNGVPASSIDRLVNEGLLEKASPPTFGHLTRSAYLRYWLTEHCNNECRDECTGLILAFARRIQTINRDRVPYVGALIALAAPAEFFAVDSCTRGFCEAAIGLSSVPITGALLLQTSKQLQRELDPSAAALAAMGLFNAFEYANTGKMPGPAEIFLDELRELQKNYSGSEQVRECLARALCNSIGYAGVAGDPARGNDRLDELEALQQRYPTDNEVRRRLASGLFNDSKNAKAAATFSRRDQNIGKLRLLTQEFSGDGHLRGMFAQVLGDTVATYQTGQQIRDELLVELRALSKSHPDDPAVGEGLARAVCAELFRALLPFGAAGDKDALLDELRAIHQNNPRNAAVRGIFAQALLHSVITASLHYEGIRRDALRDELCALYEAHPNDEAVRRCWESRYPPPDL